MIQLHLIYYRDPALVTVAVLCFVLYAPFAKKLR